MDAVRHFELALDEDTELGQPTKKSRKETGERNKHMDIKSLVQEFFGAPSAEHNININSRDISVLERWFSELDVAWVLHLPGDDASAELHHTSAAAAERWIRGLHKILETCFDVIEEEYEDQVSSEKEHGDQPVFESDKRDNNVQIQFAKFTKEAMLKMLPSVDMAIRQVVVCINGMPPAPYKKLHTLLLVYEALSDAADKIRSSSGLFSSAVVYRILGEMDKMLSAKREEVGDVIWSTMETSRTLVLGSMHTVYADNSSSSLIPQAPSDIHMATMSVMVYISFLLSNSSLMRQIVSKAVRLGKYVPEISQEKPLDSMIMDMTSCLEEKLVKMSESFLDQGLRFLFLLNNAEFIRQTLIDSVFCYGLLYHEEGEGLAKKVERYIESYLHACWEPVLSCLFSPTPLCFGINHSPLLKFESEFKKTYATQKLWKVPDPELRKRLRTAITTKIVPRYIEYIMENNVTTPGVAPQDLQNMLEELFEG